MRLLHSSSRRHAESVRRRSLPLAAFRCATNASVLFGHSRDLSASNAGGPLFRDSRLWFLGLYAMPAVGAYTPLT